jgi:hypothetical protein
MKHAMSMWIDEGVEGVYTSEQSSHAPLEWHNHAQSQPNKRDARQPKLAS